MLHVVFRRHIPCLNPVRVGIVIDFVALLKDRQIASRIIFIPIRKMSDNSHLLRGRIDQNTGSVKNSPSGAGIGSAWPVKPITNIVGYATWALPHVHISVAIHSKAIYRPQYRNIPRFLKLSGSGNYRTNHRHQQEHHPNGSPDQFIKFFHSPIIHKLTF